MTDIVNLTQERRVMIVPVGLERARIIEGYTAYAINVVYLVDNEIIKNKNNEVAAVYNYAKNFSQKIMDEFKESHITVLSIESKLNSFMDCIYVLNKIYKLEDKTGKLKQFFINISTATKAFALAAYIFGLFHRNITTIFYMGTSEYILLNFLEKNDLTLADLRGEFLENGLTRGPYSIEEIPLLPIINFSDDEKIMIGVLSKQEKFKSIDHFINMLPKSLQLTNRVRIRRILSSLEEKGLVKVEKKGRYQIIIASQILRQLNKILGIK